VTDPLQDNMRRLFDDALALRAGSGDIRRARCGGCQGDILRRQNDRLRHQLLELTLKQFGARSERLPEEQLQLGLETLEYAIAMRSSAVRR
jgi:hypothetical protein